MLCQSLKRTFFKKNCVTQYWLCSRYTYLSTMACSVGSRPAALWLNKSLIYCDWTTVFQLWFNILTKGQLDKTHFLCSRVKEIIQLFHLFHFKKLKIWVLPGFNVGLCDTGCVVCCGTSILLVNFVILVMLAVVCWIDPVALIVSRETYQ